MTDNVGEKPKNSESSNVTSSGNDGPDWKEYARIWESRAKENLEQLNAVKAQLEELKAKESKLNEQIAAAQQRAEEEKALAVRSIRDEYTLKLVKLHFESAFKAKGAEPPQDYDNFINLNNFVDEKSGEVNSDLIKQFVESFAVGGGDSPRFNQALSSGPQEGKPAQPDYSPRAIAERVRALSPY